MLFLMSLFCGLIIYMILSDNKCQGIRKRRRIENASDSGCAEQNLDEKLIFHLCPGRSLASWVKNVLEGSKQKEIQI